MIIDDFDICRSVFGPGEAKAELVVDSNTVLALSSAAQGFQVVTGGERRNSRFSALSSNCSFRSAIVLNLENCATHFPSYNFFVCLHRKDRIVIIVYRLSAGDK